MKGKEKCWRISLLYPPDALSKFVWEKDDKKQIERTAAFESSLKFHCMLPLRGLSLSIRMSFLL
jgi:hypothetical protein